jgi:hydroxymethylglutaryl-CoA lyase
MTLNATPSVTRPEWPAAVTLVEVGPRDGFQVEKTFIPTALKLEIIRGLVDAGLTQVQVASFVHPARVPQMADAEAICAALLPAPAGVQFSGLVLNVKGVHRALATGLTCLDVSIASDDGQSQSNAGMSVADARLQAREMIRVATAAGCTVRAGLQVVFGYRAPGDVPLARVVEMATEFAGEGVESVSLADSTGMADPLTMERTVAAVREAIGGIPIVLHLHDTRGMGLANVVAGLRQGVTRFDTSLGGMGGCPFIAGATGNIPTDDTAHMLEQMGVRTGIDHRAVSRLALRLEAFLGRRFDGKLHALPGLASEPPAGANA